MKVMDLLKKSDEEIKAMSTDFPEVETDFFSTRSPKKLAKELLAIEKAKSIFSSIEYSPIFSIFTVHRRTDNDERVYYVVSNGKCWRRIWSESEAAREVAKRMAFFGNCQFNFFSAIEFSMRPVLRKRLLELLEIPLDKATHKKQVIEEISKLRLKF